MVIQFREISQSLVVRLLLVTAFVTSAGCRRTGSEGGASWGAGQLNGPQQARSERDFILSLQQALNSPWQKTEISRAVTKHAATGR